MAKKKTPRKIKQIGHAKIKFGKSQAPVEVQTVQGPHKIEKK